MLLCVNDANKVGECAPCSQGKLILQPSWWKLPTELIPKLQRLQGDICGPISPISGPFRYYLVLVDASSTQSELFLLSTCNLIFPKILAILLRFCTHYPNQPVRSLQINNAKEFRSHHFEDFCVASGITLTYSVPYEHSQNGLAEAFIKKVQLIARPLLLHARLPSSLWSHVVLQAAALLKYRPILLNDHTPLELTTGQVPNVSHFRVFGCRIWVPVSEPHRKTIRSHRQEGIYIGFDSQSIIRYVHPTTGTLHKARFQNYHLKSLVFLLWPPRSHKLTWIFGLPPLSP